jgi:hypothetical protein
MAEKNHSKVFVYGDYLGMGFCVLPKDKAEELADLGDDVGHGCETTAREFFDRCRQKPGIYGKAWAEELLDDLEAGEFELALDDPDRDVVIVITYFIGHAISGPIKEKCDRKGIIRLEARPTKQSVLEVLERQFVPGAW